MSRIIFKENVLEKARQRVKTAFDDFPRIVVNFSGGKDSLVILNLALEQAEQRDRQIALAFLDQEAEWDATIVEIKRWMQHPRIIPYWCRVPFIMENSTSTLSESGHYLITYDPEKKDEWIHPYDSLAFHTFPQYINDRFDKMKAGVSDSGIEVCNGKRYPGFYLALSALTEVACDKQKSAIFNGMRANEALGRVMMCTRKDYKNINGTHGGINQYSNQLVMNFSPIYDWKGSDVWKYIYDCKLPYNTLYDKLYQFGQHHRQMRVSSVCHEMALGSISILSEIEPDCWSRVQKRLVGTNSFKQAQLSYQCPHQFPSVFKSWKDYRDYLFEALTPEDKKPALAKILAHLNCFMGTEDELEAVRTQIRSILICDLTGTYIKRFAGQHKTFQNFAKMGGIEQKILEKSKAEGVSVVEGS